VSLAGYLGGSVGYRSELHGAARSILRARGGEPAGALIGAAMLVLPSHQELAVALPIAHIG
jgi:hypothetical protein